MSTVRVERASSSVTVLTLDRPETLNALNDEVVTELRAALAELALDDQCRAVVLTGAGRGFCSGHDMSSMENDVEEIPTPASAWRVQESFASLVLEITALPQPVIAAVNGVAAGGGFALALVCDTRIAAESARFNAAFVKIGLTGADLGLSFLLPKIVGPTAAFELMLTGRMIDASEAARLGLVHDVVSEDAVVASAIATAEMIAANSPFGVRITKQTMWENLGATSLRAAIQLENRTQALCMLTHDHALEVKRFLDSRNQVSPRSPRST